MPSLTRLVVRLDIPKDWTRCSTYMLKVCVLVRVYITNKKSGTVTQKDYAHDGRKIFDFYVTTDLDLYCDVHFRSIYFVIWNFFLLPWVSSHI